MSTLTQFYGASAANLVPVELLIVGGGGAGASVIGQTSSSTGQGRSGGGSGRLIFSSTTVSKGLAYTITIGAGGAAPSSTLVLPSPGNSSFFGLIEAAGGIGAVQNGNGSYLTIQRPSLCGSLGGQSNFTASSAVTTALPATLPPVFMHINSADNFYYSLANLGGFATFNNVSGVGGGGGAGCWGSGSVTTGLAPGGSGFAVRIVGSSVFYASGGVGRGGNAGNSTGVAGTDNTGDGGGGASILALPLIDYLGGNGGSGVVIIAYIDTYPAPTSITGTYDQPTRTGYRVYRFTGSGSITF